MGRKTRSAQRMRDHTYAGTEEIGVGDILKADLHAFHDTIEHVFATSGAMIFSGCVGTRVAMVPFFYL